MRTATIRAAALAAVALVAGCQEPRTIEKEGNGSMSIDPAQPAAVTPAISGAEGESIAEEQRKAAQTAFAWTGRFAASRELCTGGGVWDIGRRRIVTQGETACEVQAVREDAGGTVELDLQCVAEGNRTRERWTLVRQGEGMRLTRAPQGSEAHRLDMVRCG